jgi:hypothetical protein
VIAKGEVSCFILTKEDVAALSCCKGKESAKLRRKEKQLKTDIWVNLVDMGCVGKGTFGSVHMVQDTSNNRIYAMKVTCVCVLSCVF